jgi:hypothetical protein
MRRIYENRLICSALCQGAAIHYAMPKHGYGIKDFDVWSFFALSRCGQPLGMFRRRAVGKRPSLHGKTIDLFWRSISA